MDCLCPKTVKKEEKKYWLDERKNVRMYNARLSAIIDELEEYYHYEEYKKRFKLLFEFYKLEKLLKYLKNIIRICYDRMVPPVASAPCASISASIECGNGL